MELFKSMYVHGMHISGNPFLESIYNRTRKIPKKVTRVG